MISLLTEDGIIKVPIDLFLSIFKIQHNIDDDLEALDAIASSGLENHEFAPLSEQIFIGDYLMVPTHITDEAKFLPKV